jgi:hypothetical protein
LAFQRYSRKTQDGQGDDILSGNSLAVVGLYLAIYGFNPLYNRFYLNPHITKEISGSRLNYNYRGQRLIIGLDTNLYTISNDLFTVSSTSDFGFFSTGNTVLYFNKDNPAFSIKADVGIIKHLDLNIIEYNAKAMVWNQIVKDTSGQVTYIINNLMPGSAYSIYADERLLKKIKSDLNGHLMFHQTFRAKKIKILLQQ